MGKKSSRKKKRGRKRQQPSRPPQTASAPKKGAGKPARTTSKAAGRLGVKPLELGWKAALVANVLILATWLYARILQDVSRDFYSRSGQEDE